MIVPISSSPLSIGTASVCADWIDVERNIRYIRDQPECRRPAPSVAQGSARRYAVPSGRNRITDDPVLALRADAVGRDRPQLFAVEAENVGPFGFAKSHRVLRHGVEHRLQVEGGATDHLEHFAGGGLLLQRLGQIVSALAQLAEQARALDSDDGLSGEIRHQLDLLVTEWPNFLPIDRERANHLPIFQHRHSQECAKWAQFDTPLATGSPSRYPVSVRQIRDMNCLAGACGPSDREAWTGMKHDARLKLLAVCGRDAVGRRHKETTILGKPQHAEFGTTDMRGVLQDGLEYWLQFTRRTADDLEHVGGGGLLLERFAQFVQQTGVLYGDDGLIREGPHQRAFAVP